MNQAQLEEYATRYTNGVDTACELLDQVRLRLDEGKKLKQEHILRVHESLTDLAECEETIFSGVSELYGGSPPADGMNAVETMIELGHQYYAKAEEALAEIRERKAILELFSKMSTTDATCVEALEEMQEIVEKHCKLHREIGMLTSDERQHFLEHSEAAVLFVEAIREHRTQDVGIINRLNQIVHEEKEKYGENAWTLVFPLMRGAFLLPDSDPGQDTGSSRGPCGDLTEQAGKAAAKESGGHESSEPAKIAVSTEKTEPAAASQEKKAAAAEMTAQDAVRVSPEAGRASEAVPAQEPEQTMSEMMDEASEKPAAASYRAVNTGLTGSPGATAFRNKIRKLAKRCSGIPGVVLTLARYGACSIDIMVPVLDPTLAAERQRGILERERDNNALALDILTKTGYVVRWENPDDPESEPLFTISEYVQNGMKCTSVAEDATLWQPYKPRSIRSSSADAECIVREYARNLEIYQYLCNIALLTGRENDDILSRAEWTGDHYLVEVPNAPSQRAHLLPLGEPGIEVPECASLLYVGTEEELESGAVNTDHPAYFCTEKVLMRRLPGGEWTVVLELPADNQAQSAANEDQVQDRETDDNVPHTDYRKITLRAMNEDRRDFPDSRRFMRELRQMTAQNALVPSLLQLAGAFGATTLKQITARVDCPPDPSDVGEAVAILQTRGLLRVYRMHEDGIEIGGACWELTSYAVRGLRNKDVIRNAKELGFELYEPKCLQERRSDDTDEVLYRIASADAIARFMELDLGEWEESLVEPSFERTLLTMEEGNGSAKRLQVIPEGWESRQSGDMPALFASLGETPYVAHAEPGSFAICGRDYASDTLFFWSEADECWVKKTGDPAEDPAGIHAQQTASDQPEQSQKAAERAGISHTLKAGVPDPERKQEPRAADSRNMPKPKARVPEKKVTPDTAVSEFRDRSEPAAWISEEEQKNDGTFFVLYPEPEVQSEADVAAQAPDQSNILEADRWPVPPTDEDFADLICKILESPEDAERRVPAALLLAKAASFVPENASCADLYKKLSLAANLGFGDLEYTAQNLTQTFEDEGESTGHEALKLASYIFVLLTAPVPGDFYNLPVRNLMEEYDKLFPDLPQFKSLLSTICVFFRKYHKGFNEQTLLLLGDAEDRSRFVRGLQGEAEEFLRSKTPNSLTYAFGSGLFAGGSDVYECLRLVAENREAEVEIAEIYLSDFCRNGDVSAPIIQDSLIEERLLKERGTDRRELFPSQRSTAVRAFRERLELLAKWVQHCRSRAASQEDISILEQQKEKILAATESLRKDSSWNTLPYAAVLSWMLDETRSLLKGTTSNLKAFSDVLKTGAFSIGDNGIPIVESLFQEVRYCEPWRNAIRHLRTLRDYPDLTWSTVVSQIQGGSGAKLDLMDNMHQLKMIAELPEFAERGIEIKESDRKRAKAYAKEYTRSFGSRLESAYTFGQIDRSEKEQIQNAVEEFEDHFNEQGDYACWRWFLDGLSRQLDEFVGARGRTLKEQLDALRARHGDEPEQILTAAAEYLGKGKYILVEEYMARYNAGALALPRSGEPGDESDWDYFAEFRLEYPTLYAACQKRNQRSGRAKEAWYIFARKYLQSKIDREDMSRANLRDVHTFVGALPQQNSMGSLQTFLQGLGFENVKVQEVKRTKRIAQFEARVERAPRELERYPHPIAAFGTQIHLPLNVIVISGQWTPKQLFDTFALLNLRDLPIVISDYFWSENERRTLADLAHEQKTARGGFVLLDQVLTLYLGTLPETERLAAFLQCALPYTVHQPFQGGCVADEMFTGRQRELSEIISPGGKCIVYGGRQLGKTALLQRAQHMENRPESRHYAAYADIGGCRTEEDAVRCMLESLREAFGAPSSFGDCTTFQDLCDQIYMKISRHEVDKLLLLVDEADQLLKGFKENAYAQLQPFDRLRTKSDNRFKIVVAGLHNVCRATEVLRENSVVGHWGEPLCIRPLSADEAVQLVSRPLRFLGVRNADEYYETLAAKSLYFPGALQLCGRQLIETALFGKLYKTHYSASQNPPFELQEIQLGAIANSADLNHNIQKLIEMTLKLDHRYMMLACCITYLHYLEDTPGAIRAGYSVKEICEVADGYGIQSLKVDTSTDEDDVRILLDELVDMGILTSPEQGRTYRLRRASFADLIAENPERLERKLVEGAKIACAEEK